MDIVYQLVNGLSGLPAQESRLARFFLDNFAQARLTGDPWTFTPPNTRPATVSQE